MTWISRMRLLFVALDEDEDPREDVPELPWEEEDVPLVPLELP